MGMGMSEFITTISVIDPSSGDIREIQMWRTSNGIVGVDADKIHTSGRGCTCPYTGAVLDLKLPEDPASEDKGYAEKQLCLSICAQHITEEDTHLLADNPVIYCDEHKDGWWLRVPEECCGRKHREQYYRDLREFGFSEDFTDVIRAAVREECMLISITGTNPFYPGLNRNEW